MLRIVIERNGELIWDRTADRQLVTIGRSTDNDLVLADEQVSAHHLVVKRGADGSFTAIDQSVNGTWHDGQKVSTVRIESPKVLILAGYEVTLIPVEKTGTEEADVPSSGGTTVTEDLPVLEERLAKSDPRPAAKLQVTLEDGRVDTISFVDSALIGRDEDCDLIIPGREISRKHAFVFRRGGHYLVKRLSRVNPVRANTRVLEQGESSELVDGDTIDVSGVKVKFLRPGDALGDRATLVEGRQPNIGFSVDVRRESREIVRVELLGFLGEKTAQRFEASTESLCNGARKIIIDLGYLVGIDESGIASLVRLAAECDRKRVAFRLENVGPRVRDTLDGSSLRRVVAPYIHDEKPVDRQGGIG